MYNIYDESSENVIGIKIVQDLNKKDFATLLPFLGKRIRKYKNLRLLTDLREFEEPRLWDSLLTLPKLLRLAPSIEKEAVVTDTKWIITATKILARFFQTEVRLFSSEEIDDAWEWIRR
jgi:hypothetical protein